MPSAYGGCDEEELCTRQTCQTPQDSSGKAPRWPKAVRSPSDATQKRRWRGLPVSAMRRWNNRRLRRTRFRSSQALPGTLSECSRQCWRRQFRFATPSLEISTGGTAPPFSSLRPIARRLHSPKIVPTGFHVADFGAYQLPKEQRRYEAGGTVPRSLPSLASVGLRRDKAILIQS